MVLALTADGLQHRAKGLLAGLVKHGGGATHGAAFSEPNVIPPATHAVATHNSATANDSAYFVGNAHGARVPLTPPPDFPSDDGKGGAVVLFSSSYARERRCHIWQHQDFAGAAIPITVMAGVFFFFASSQGRKHPGRFGCPRRTQE